MTADASIARLRPLIDQLQRELVKVMDIEVVISREQEFASWKAVCIRFHMTSNTELNISRHPCVLETAYPNVHRSEERRVGKEC